MKRDIVPRALSHLYLHAVLPALVELVLFDAEARATINRLSFRLSIGVVGEQAVTLQIKNDEVIFNPQDNEKNQIKLLFLTHSHLNSFFGGNKWSLPLVTRGLWRVNAMKSFALLTERLNIVLQDNTSTCPLYTRLVFLIGGLGLLPLAQFDSFAQSVLAKTPFGLAEFSINDNSIKPLWFDNGLNNGQVGQGEPPRIPDVRVQFSDINIANAALRNDIDTMAAIGSQRIKIEGLSPLAEGLGLMMERLNVYLER
jgi:hypothetical protein